MAENRRVVRPMSRPPGLASIRAIRRLGLDFGTPGAREAGAKP